MVAHDSDDMLISIHKCQRIAKKGKTMITENLKVKTVSLFQYYLFTLRLQSLFTVLDIYENYLWS